MRRTVRRRVRRIVRRRRTRVSKTSKQFFELHKAEAKTVLSQKVQYFFTKYTEVHKVELKQFQNVSIKNTATRWGSCSSKGNLNFSVKLITLPIHLLEYVVVHEICHLKEFNHSSKFWDLVRLEMPDYALYRQELKQHALM